MTSEQKAALDQLFEEIDSASQEYTASIDISRPIQSNLTPNKSKERFDHLRSTFADRVEQIMKPVQMEMHDPKTCTVLECGICNAYYS